ncbi:MAG: hypothetical protein WD876_02135 [Candidatus Pacearchaeota archaeon]
MQWYDYIIIIGVVIGMLFVFFGSYHDHRGRKTGIWGWVIIITLLILRVLIWIAGTIK